MKIWARIIFAGLMLTFTLTAVGYFFWLHPNLKKYATMREYVKTENKVDPTIYLRLYKKAQQVRDFTKAGGYNTQKCFLVDMKMGSGQSRFFIYNLVKDSIEKAGLVAHGSGSNKGSEELFFSNVPNSNCTSVGKYCIGSPYLGKFGLAYKLYGLDETNNKAYERFIVLHAHSCVPDEEIAPELLCESWGCPTVSPGFLQELRKNISSSAKPMLLWVYY